MSLAFRWVVCFAWFWCDVGFPALGFGGCLGLTVFCVSFVVWLLSGGEFYFGFVSCCSGFA